MATAFSLGRKPLSLNAKLSRGYVEAIAQAARLRHHGRLFDTALYSRIVWFHKRPIGGGDIDNVAKRIHDAMRQVVFDDDRRITHSLAIRVDMSEQTDIVADVENPEAFQELSELLGDP